MVEFTWKILELSAENEVINHAKYMVTATDGTNTVETEGNWYFKAEPGNVPFSQVTEELVAQWVENETMKDGVCVIKSRLEEQLAEISKSKTVVPPWKPQVFTPEI